MYLLSNKSDFHLLITFLNYFGLALILLNEGQLHFLVTLLNDFCDIMSFITPLNFCTDLDILFQVFIEDIPLL